MVRILGLQVSAWLSLLLMVLNLATHYLVLRSWSEWRVGGDARRSQTNKLFTVSNKGVKTTQLLHLTVQLQRSCFVFLVRLNSSKMFRLCWHNVCWCVLNSLQSNAGTDGWSRNYCGLLQTASTMMSPSAQRQLSSAISSSFFSLWLSLALSLTHTHTCIDKIALSNHTHTFWSWLYRHSIWHPRIKDPLYLWPLLIIPAPPCGKPGLACSSADSPSHANVLWHASLHNLDCTNTNNNDFTLCTHAVIQQLDRSVSPGWWPGFGLFEPEMITILSSALFKDWL